MNIKKLLKEAAFAVISAGTTLIIAACYGVYEDYRPGLATGFVKDESGLGIPGIQVCAELPVNEICTSADSQGSYYLDAEAYVADEANENGFTLYASDVDGEQNGWYQGASVTVTPEDMQQGQGLLEHDFVLEANTPGANE